MMKKTLLIVLILNITYSNAQENTISNLDTVNVENNSGVVSIKDVETLPILKDCDKFIGNKELSECLYLNINRIIGMNFNASIAKKQRIKTKVVKIIGRFTIDSIGNIVNIRVDHENEALRNEMTRVIKLIPSMTPAKLNNKPVSVEFKIPIAFSNKNNSLL